MISPERQKIIFVTGTDTGVGKTVATVSLLHYLRKTGVHALAMKPFCTGDRADIEAIQAVQESDQISIPTCKMRDRSEATRSSGLNPSRHM